MDMRFIKNLIKLIEESNIDELELTLKNIGKIKITKTIQSKYQISQSNPNITGTPLLHQIAIPSGYQNPDVSTIQHPPGQVKIETKKKTLIKSPMVGTFYRAPSPDSEPYVKVGDYITKNQVLCIIEAMKIMNELESDVSGRLVEILVENGSPVEYNQELFVIEQD